MFAAALRRDFTSRRCQGKLATFLVVGLFVSFFPWVGLLAWVSALLGPALACLAAARDRAAETDEQLRIAGIGAVEAAASAVVARMAWILAIALAFVPALAMYAGPAAVPHLVAVALAIGCAGTGIGLAVGRRLNGLIGILGSYVLLAALIYGPPTLFGIPNLFERSAGWESILLASDLGFVVAIAGFARRNTHVREVLRRSAPVDRGAAAWGELRRWRSPAAAMAIVGSVAIAEWIGRFLSQNQMPDAPIFATLLAPVILATLAGASAVASERERGTLSLLRLAMDDGEIVRQKVAGFLRGTWMLLPVPAATALAIGEGLAVGALVAFATFVLVVTALAAGITCSRAFRGVGTATATAFGASALASIVGMPVVLPRGLAGTEGVDLDAAFLILTLWAVVALEALFLATRSDSAPEIDRDPEPAMAAAPDARHAASRTAPDVARDVRRLRDRIDDLPAGRLTVAEVGGEGALSVADDPRGRLSVRKSPRERT